MASNFLRNSVSGHYVIGLFVRFALILYGDYQDHHSDVHYTDVDYHVITDAAQFVSEGHSPFLRHTYRYTPYLSWLMIPNILFHVSTGKILFSIIDLIATHIIYRILRIQSFSREASLKSALMWLYNPLVIGISTRGSPEAIVVTLVLLTLFFHAQRKVFLSGILLGSAIHFKIYPIIYSLPLYLSLEDWRIFSFLIFLPTKRRLYFTISVVFSFLILSMSGYILYGNDYIDEAFMYHLTRVDTRHNFSIYFYLLYISVHFNIIGLGFATFAPQLILVIAYGVAYGNKKDLVLSLFAQTLCFVSFNKVVTSQYFIWYIVFIPLLYPSLRISTFKTILLPVLWAFAQAAWLLPAYLFEFHGYNVFVPIWLESVAFFSCNVGILMGIISSYFARENAVVRHKTQ